MNVTSEKTGPCEYTLTIEVDEERTEKALRRTARQITQRAPIPGFRPGKAPYNIIQNYFGKEAIYSRALETLGPEVYEEALEEAELDPYAQGNLDMEEMEPLVLKAVVPVQPIVEIGDYRSIRSEKPDIPFSEDDIDEAIEELREQHAEWQPVDRPVQEGDQVTIDLTGMVGEEEVISQSSRRTQVMENMFPDGLYENILGVEPGTGVDYDVSFEEDHSNPRFAGETVSFHLEVLGVSEKQLPEVDADFAQVVGGFGSVEELRDEIREKLFESKREQARDEIAGEILAEILEDATLEYPDVAVEQAIDRQIQEIRMNLQSQGFAWETYLSMQGKTEEGIRDEIRSTAEQNLRESLLLGKIAEAEEIPVEEEQIEAEIDRMLAPYGPPGEQLRPYFSSGAMRDDIERRIRIGNTLEWLIDMATGQLEDAEEEPVAEAATDAEPSQEEPAEVEPEAQKGAEDVTASSKEEA